MLFVLNIKVAGEAERSGRNPPLKKRRFDAWQDKEMMTFCGC